MRRITKLNFSYNTLKPEILVVANLLIDGTMTVATISVPDAKTVFFFETIEAHHELWAKSLINDIKCKPDVIEMLKNGGVLAFDIPDEIFNIPDISKQDAFEFSVKLSEERTPNAYRHKLFELINDGAFETFEEAKEWLDNNEFNLTLFYDVNNGLFAVEPEWLEQSVDGKISSPYNCI